MIYCKGCNCIIVPGRAYLAAGGYYCRYCIERMRSATAGEPTIKITDERSGSIGQM